MIKFTIDLNQNLFTILVNHILIDNKLSRQSKRKHERFNSCDGLSDPDIYEKRKSNGLMVLGENELITFNTDLQWDDELDKFVEVPLPM